MLRGNIVDLAVAFVIGLALVALMTAFVMDWVTPIVGAIFGGQGAFDDLSFTINDSVFHYGHFIDALITFVAIAASVFFFVVKPMGYYLERRRRGEEPAAELPPDIELLTEIRDLLKSRAT